MKSIQTRKSSKAKFRKIVNMDDHETLHTTHTTSTMTMTSSSHHQKQPQHLLHDEINRSEHFSHRKQTTNCWFEPPCEPLILSYFFSVRGQDGFHIYLWIMKDLCWVQAWYWPGLIFGTATLTWSSFMLWRACSRKSLDEVWTHSAQFMWLFGNFLWMQGELHDNQFPNEPSVYNQRADQAGYIFIAALIWISIYYFIAKPLNITSSAEVNAPYDATGFKCRFSYFFHTWREYENVHILFWIGKDCFWCWYISYMWILFFIPTFFIAFDFCYVSLRGKNMVIDHAHYVSQLLWVAANATWGAGEFFFSVNHDSALSMTAWNRDIRLTFRWYSAWVVVSAYIPLIVLYLIWIPSTIIGRIEDDEEKETDLERLNTAGNSSSSAPSTSSLNQQQQLSHLPCSQSTTTSTRKLNLFQQTFHRLRSLSEGIQLSQSSGSMSSSTTSRPTTGAAPATTTTATGEEFNHIHSMGSTSSSLRQPINDSTSKNALSFMSSDDGVVLNGYDGDHEGKDVY